MLTRRTGLKPGKPLGRCRINPVSIKRRRENREYTVLRKAFLEGHSRCEWPEGCHAAATDVHHMRGRVGSLYLDVGWWKALCRTHHQRATDNPAEAIRLGVSASRLAGEQAS